MRYPGGKQTQIDSFVETDRGLPRTPRPRYGEDYPVDLWPTESGDYDDLVPLGDEGLTPFESSGRPGLVDNIKDRIDSALAWVEKRWDRIESEPDPKKRRAGKLGAAAIVVAGTLVHIGVLGSGVVAAHELMEDDPDKMVLVESDQEDSERLAELEQAALTEAPYFAESENFLSEKQNDLNQDPVYRASSLTVSGSQANSVDSYTLGSGSLVEYDGSLYFATVRHVTDTFSEEQSSEDFLPTVYVPGVGFMRPEFSQRFEPDISPEVEISDDLGDGDANVLIPFSDVQEELLRSKQKEGVISPLQPASENPEFGQRFQIVHPETGESIELTYRGVDPGYSYSETGSLRGFGSFTVEGFEDDDYPDPAEVQATGDYLCQGSSGSAITSIEDPSSFFGTLSAIQFVLDDGGRVCGVNIKAPIV